MRRTRWSAAPVALALSIAVTSLAGCGSAPTAASPTPVGTSGMLQARAAARAEAARLVGLAVVPDGAQPLPVAPSPLLRPAEQAMVTSREHAERFWRVTLPYARAKAWLASHPAPGLVANGGMSASDHGTETMSGVRYYDPQTRSDGRLGLSTLNVDVAPDGGTASVIRADAEVIWLDPAPMPDDAVGPRLQVTVAGGCPARTAGAVGVVDAASDLTTQLVPPQPPSTGLVCGYDGTGRRTRVVALTAAQSLDLVRQLRALPLAHEVGRVSSCPMDDGSVEVLVLHYPDRADVAVWSRPTGCSTVTNGHIAARGRVTVSPRS